MANENKWPSEKDRPMESYENKGFITALIVKKVWIMQLEKRGPEFIQEGWFMFGIIPLYIRDIQCRGRRS